MAPKCVPHLLLGSLMERGSQPLANCSLSLVTVPEVFAKVNSAQFLYLFFFFLIFFFHFIFIAPLAPYVGEITDIRASKSSAVIQLWPAEQRNGPIRYDQKLAPSLIDFRSQQYFYATRRQKGEEGERFVCKKLDRASTYVFFCDLLLTLLGLAFTKRVV